MIIYIVGDFSEDPDEGFRNIAYHITKELSKDNKVLKINEKKLFSLTLWKTIIYSDYPQVIHHLTDPTLRSLFALKITKLFWRNSTTVVSALFPHISSQQKKFMSVLQPDLILTQSDETDSLFKSFGYRSRFLTNGVDTKRFLPVTKNYKEKLREKYGIDKEKFVVLHVGHVRENRNLQLFRRIHGGDVQGVIVGSDYIEVNQKICQDLKKIGCILLLGYYENIEEIYALSDCYIFPVKENQSILTPLSVLEAMSCNLPVVTRGFYGLKRIFSEGDGLLYAEKDEDFIHSLNTIRQGVTVKTRNKVLPYSWEEICKELSRIYNDLLQINGKK